jgi:hypothetical protein
MAHKRVVLGRTRNRVKGTVLGTAMGTHMDYSRTYYIF